MVRSTIEDYVREICSLLGGGKQLWLVGWLDTSKFTKIRSHGYREIVTTLTGTEPQGRQIAVVYEDTKQNALATLARPVVIETISACERKRETEF